MYSDEPTDRDKFTREFDQVYTRIASLYDVFVKSMPFWKRWISCALPVITGPRVLEISFGTGYLLTQYAAKYSTYGVDYNAALIRTAKRNLRRSGVSAELQQADVYSLPYPSETFDCVVNTMAFTGYPEGGAALDEIHRVLKQGGTLILIDINYPADGNWIGTALVRLWSQLGDLIRDMGPVFHKAGFQFREEEIGGFGSVHRYLAKKIGTV